MFLHWSLGSLCLRVLQYGSDALIVPPVACARQRGNNLCFVAFDRWRLQWLFDDVCYFSHCHVVGMASLSCAVPPCAYQGARGNSFDTHAVGSHYMLS